MKRLQWVNVLGSLYILSAHVLVYTSDFISQEALEGLLTISTKYHEVCNFRFKPISFIPYGEGRGGWEVHDIPTVFS